MNPREAQFAAQGVVVRLHPTDTGTAVLTVRTLSGTNLDHLRRTYDRHQQRTAERAYEGMCTLFAAGWTRTEVEDFARTMAPPPALPEVLPALCEVAA